MNKVHSPTIFCVVLSDLIGFRDALICPSFPLDFRKETSQFEVFMEHFFDQLNWPL